MSSPIRSSRARAPSPGSTRTSSREGGAFGSRDWNGEDVHDGTYGVNGETLVISKEFPDVGFRYRIEGDTITFDPVIPERVLDVSLRLERVDGLSRQGVDARPVAGGRAAAPRKRRLGAKSPSATAGV
jgi:hypothetical protein